MTRRPDSGGPMDIEPDVVVAPDGALASVDARPHPDPGPAGPVVTPRDARWKSTAAAMASSGDVKTAKKESPSVDTTIPE